MSTALWNFLFNVYIGRESRAMYPGRRRSDHPIQIDDQDDNDPIDGFCNILVSVGKRNRFTMELVGTFPLTNSISDLIEIYDGFVDKENRRLAIRLDIDKINAIGDLAELMRAASSSDRALDLPNWRRISGRTISSLRRFVRVLREFQRTYLKNS